MTHRERAPARGLRLLFAAVALALAAVFALAPAHRQRVSVRAREAAAVGRAWLWTRRAGYELHRNVSYVRVGGWQGELDLYRPTRATSPTAVIVLFHGGGWIEGSKELTSVLATRLAEVGFAVANVEYRLASEAPAPAAIEDARCAVRWVVSNAVRYGLDGSRIVTVGGSAGGHLALMAALTSPEAGFDRNCGSGPVPRVAAAIGWAAPTDLTLLRRVPAARSFTDAWVGADTAAARVARLSPISYARPNAPLVILLHGDADDLVPVEQARELHRALDAAGARNELHIIRGNGHWFPEAVQDSLIAAARATLSRLDAR